MKLSQEAQMNLAYCKAGGQMEQSNPVRGAHALAQFSIINPKEIPK
jgi:hypothetical protein